ncbi:PREDICTED: zinc finger BED domain-containing protein RICESLEEPER 2-like [Camelina sativa]|uniref:Zinc finger BED domain-containing protein RICESLEEPER 2-like n=1 Tax=Camelina sativa TaxID=90675 RepID=A0ABM0WBN0_CAMSA|nr:PREDICTED: zinc finger BED domain-containing protein RICESLEEPER 2-like [Camelina sativa]
MTKFKKAMKNIGDDALILKGKYMHLRCATHILNLVVREGLQEVDNSVARIRNGIQYVRATTNRLKTFDLRLEAVKIKRGSVPLDVKTRWNSTYLMLDQALKFRLAFERMEAEDKVYNDYFLEKVDGTKRIGPPMPSDFDEVERLVSTLVIFYKSTLVLSASNTVASHKLYNEIVSVTKNLSELTTSTNPEDPLKKKALSMLTKLAKYWDPFGDQVEMNRLVIVASVFDPRKKTKFAEQCFDALYGKGSMESVHLLADLNSILKDLYDEYSRNSLLNKTGSSSQSHGSSSHSQTREQVTPDFCQKADIVDMENVFDEMLMEKVIYSSSNELEIYLKDNVEKPSILKGTKYDLLSWWKVNSGKYPILSLIAKDILAMQVSSVASESAFSTSGRILEPYRSCLTHKMIEVLICTEQWLKAEIYINEKGVSTVEHLLSEVEHDDELLRGVVRVSVRVFVEFGILRPVKFLDKEVPRVTYMFLKT